MGKNSSYHDLIEKYLEGTLAAECESFEEQLKTDPILSKELLNRKMIQTNWIKAAQREQVRRHIQHVIKTGKSSQISKTMSWLMAAASLILVIGISSVFFSQRDQNKSDREFLSYGNNSNVGEAIIKGTPNEMKEYGSIDFANDNKSISYKRMLPDDGAIYQASDTITFIWPAASQENNEPLVIFNEEGKKVVEIKLRTGDIGYKLLPSTLKPGTYTYFLRPKVLNYKFSVNK